VGLVLGSNYFTNTQWNRFTVKAIAIALQAGKVFGVEEITGNSKRKETDHRLEPRRKFRHAEAVHCIKIDYLGNFRRPVDHSVRRRIQNNVHSQAVKGKVPGPHGGCTSVHYFLLHKNRENLHDNDQASLEAQLFLPIKCLAYGVLSHTFMDYFEISQEYCNQNSLCQRFPQAPNKSWFEIDIEAAQAGSQRDRSL
jgi:hypothetical protein